MLENRILFILKDNILFTKAILVSTVEVGGGVGSGGGGGGCVVAVGGGASGGVYY